MPSREGRCCHDHDCAESDCGIAYSLYKHIDLPNVTCLNELEPRSCQRIFKPWCDRTDTSSGRLFSDEEDCELLFQIPFVGSVNLKALTVIGGVDGRSPSRMRAYINRTNLDFSDMASVSAVQEWDLQEDFRGVVEYPTIASRFKGVHFLTLHFPAVFDASQMELCFLGLKGEYFERRREAVQAIYESKPMPEDHQVPGGEQGGFSRMGM